jgi:hypothetical protein
VSEATGADLDVFVARLEQQLAPEGTDRRRDFIGRLTDDTKAGEGG